MKLLESMKDVDSLRVTRRQEQFLNFIENFCKEYGYSPSVREIGRGLGLSSTSAVNDMLDRLVKKGLLNKKAGESRTSTLTEKAAEGIPIIGRIRAGMPVVSEENIEGYLPINLKKAADSFFLIVEGESMRDKGILHGDYVLIKPQCDIINGQIGAFRINGEVTLKTFQQQDGVISLTPANSEFQPIVVSENDDFEVIGRFTMLVRSENDAYIERKY
ncbi:MAG: transcriptional repressor LexA [Deferribacteraceae bacterium]|nr:transcriptional repressor LexA [Deferribacteraceae bacterium]